MQARYIWTGAALALVLAAGGCERPAREDAGAGPASAAGPSANRDFRSQLSQDLSGYYLPAAPALTGRYQLDHVFVGQAEEFAKWEAGQRSAAFAPVMLEFTAVDSAGGEGASAQNLRVLPVSYQVTDGRVVFTGRDPVLGEVRFSAALDSGGLATARRNLGEEDPVMTATLTAEGRTASGVKLTWFGGD